MADYKEIEIEKIETNDGQIEGLPSNPRQITESKLEQLKGNIQKYPKMLDLRGIMVYPHNDKFVVIGGNMRLRAMKELGFKSVPCVVIPKETSVEDLKAYTVLDNNEFGQWDFDKLANEWDEAQLTEWGIDNLPIFSTDDDGVQEEEEDGDDEQGYKIAYELVFNDEAEQTEFYDLLKDLKNELQDYDTVSERLIAALRFWRENHGEEE